MERSCFCQYNKNYLERGLKARHLTLIGLGGALGTGLLVGTHVNLWATLYWLQWQISSDCDSVELCLARSIRMLCLGCSDRKISWANKAGMCNSRSHVVVIPVNAASAPAGAPTPSLCGTHLDFIFLET